MKKRTGYLIATLAVFSAVALPLSAGAQDRHELQQQGAAHPQARPAPQPKAHAAPHPQVHAAPQARSVQHAAPRARTVQHATPHRAASRVHKPARDTRRAVQQRTPAHVRHVDRAQHKPKQHTQPAVTQAQSKIHTQTKKQANTHERRRGETRHARDQRLHERQNGRTNIQTKVQAQPNARVRHAGRRNADPRVTVQDARRGRFAAPYNANARFARPTQSRHERPSARRPPRLASRPAR